MGIIIATTTPAESKDLTKLATVKTTLGITDSANDALISRLLNAASDYIESLTGRVFAQERITEIVPGFGGLYLELTRIPVKQIHSIVQDSSPIVDYELAKSDLKLGRIYRKAGWEWKPSSWWHLGEPPTPVPGQEEHSFAVDYTAGYVLPSFAAPTVEPILPSEIEQFAISLCSDWFASRKRDGTSQVSRLKIETLEFEFQNLSMNMKDELARFTRVWSSFV